jgi:hypothetical protein
LQPENGSPEWLQAASRRHNEHYDPFAGVARFVKILWNGTVFCVIYFKADASMHGTNDGIEAFEHHAARRAPASIKLSDYRRLQ